MARPAGLVSVESLDTRAECEADFSRPLWPTPAAAWCGACGVVGKGCLASRVSSNGGPEDWAPSDIGSHEGCGDAAGLLGGW